MPALDIKNFSKNYESVEAVKNISMQIEKSELFGLIGPDGAGKTTLMRTVCTLLKPESGQILVMGNDVSKDIYAIRQILGYMPQRFSLYPDLTVEQNLQFFADLFQVPDSDRRSRLKQLYEFSRLQPFKNRQASALSGGMKQKLALSCALIHTPQILVLDEPTYGVDPVSRQEFWDILSEIKKDGTTIIVSTAYMEEAELCGRIALIHKGEIIARGTPQEVIDRYTHPLYRITGDNLHQLRTFFRNLPMVHNTQLFGDAVHVSFLTDPQYEDWEKWQKATENNLKSWKKQTPSMEDVFMELTQEAVS